MFLALHKYRLSNPLRTKLRKHRANIRPGLKLRDCPRISRLLLALLSFLCPQFLLKMDILPSTVTSQLHTLCPDTPPSLQCRVILLHRGLPVCREGHPIRRMFPRKHIREGHPIPRTFPRKHSRERQCQAGTIHTPILIRIPIRRLTPKTQVAGIIRCRTKVTAPPPRDSLHLQLPRNRDKLTNLINLGLQNSLRQIMRKQTGRNRTPVDKST